MPKKKRYLYQETAEQPYNTASPMYNHPIYSVASTSALELEYITPQIYVEKALDAISCAYCRSPWTPDSRGNCASCGAAKEEKTEPEPRPPIPLPDPRYRETEDLIIPIDYEDSAAKSGNELPQKSIKDRLFDFKDRLFDFLGIRSPSKIWYK
jgi:hypothetical protein